jgi:MerR family transcriptional regulator, light-induced transcriptional regulator
MGEHHQHDLVDHATARDAVMEAVRQLDGGAVRGVLLESLLGHGVDDTVVEVIMPVLKQVGDGWETGELSVLHEHFVSSSFRGVLGELRVPVQGDQVRTVVLACPPHELHDLPLELFGAMLHARRWRVVSLGANTPMTAIGEAVRFLSADACVLAGVRRSAFESRMPSLTRLSARMPLFLAGEGAVALPSTPPGTAVLPRDLRRAADLVDAVARDQSVQRPAAGQASGSRPASPTLADGMDDHAEHAAG